MRAQALIATLFLAGCAVSAADQRPPAPATGLPVSEASQAPSGEEKTIPTTNPDVKGVVLPVGRTIADNAAAAPPLSSFMRALAAAELTDTLRGPGPFTVFAPTDEAFSRLAPGTLDALLKPENRPALVKLLDLHIVSGRLTGVDLMRRVADGGGRATLTSLAGEPLTVTMTGGIVTLTDAGGDKSYVEIADVRQSNGVMHLVNGVLVPRLNR